MPNPNVIASEQSERGNLQEIASSSPTPRNDKVINILGIKINPLNYQEFLARIKDFLKDNGQHQIVTVNPEFIVTAKRDPQFKQILNEADLSVPDGVGLIWAGKLLGKPISTRVTGTDLVASLASVGEKEGWRFFLLGGRDGAAQEAKEVLETRFPKIQISGVFEGEGGVEGDEQTLKEVKKGGEIDILLVAYGHPKQEKWIRRNLTKTEAKIAIGVGGAFDYLSNRKKRAPALLRQIGLEWFFRLISEPSRWKRQLDLPRFIFLVFKERLNSNK